MEIPRESHTEWPGSSNLGGRCLLNRRGLLREASVKQMGTSFPGSLLAFVSIGVRSEHLGWAVNLSLENFSELSVACDIKER